MNLVQALSCAFYLLVALAFVFLCRWYIRSERAARKREAQRATEIGEKDFVFIWYKVTEIKNTSGEVIKSFTAPCRTKIKAPTLAIAQDRLASFAASKTKLVFMSEAEWKKQGNEAENIFKEFENLNKKFEKMASNFSDNIFGKN